LQAAEPARRRSGERGSAALVVLALLFLMAMFALGNNRTLHQLHQELDLLEQHQLRNPESVKKPQPTAPAAAPVPSDPAAPGEGAPSPTEPAAETPAQP